MEIPLASYRKDIDKVRIALLTGGFFHRYHHVLRADRNLLRLTVHCLLAKDSLIGIR